jgi:hypothetical protein
MGADRRAIQRAARHRRMTQKKINPQRESLRQFDSTQVDARITTKTNL